MPLHNVLDDVLGGIPPSLPQNCTFYEFESTGGDLVLNSPNKNFRLYSSQKVKNSMKNSPKVILLIATYLPQS